MTAPVPQIAGLAAIGTMHGKERVIGPLLEAELGLTYTATRDLDTDAFGTFTGEIARTRSARAAAEAKARAALEHVPAARYGIGSEGSFGPHPDSPFITVGRELVALVVRDDDLVLVGGDFTDETNCNEHVVRSVGDALDAARRFGFPGHGMVVMGVAPNGEASPAFGLAKGIVTAKTLCEVAAAFIGTCGAACVQSDMRAYFNPTRMNAIRRATEDLVRRARSFCPACGCPGYGIVMRIAGLPCEECGQPTGAARALLYECQRCDLHEERPRPDGRTSVDAGQCDSCNP